MKKRFNLSMGLLAGILFLSLGSRAQLAPGGVSGAKFWLRADTLVSPVTNGSSITAWTDISGNSNTTTLSGTTATYVQNSNGFPAVRFVGTSNIQTAKSHNYKTILWIGTLNAPNNTQVRRLFSWNTGVAPVGTERSMYLNSYSNLYLNSGMTNVMVDSSVVPYPEKRNASNVYFRFGHLEAKRQYSPRSKIYTDMLTVFGFFYNTDDTDIYTTVNGSTALYTRPHPAGHIWAPVNGKLVVGGYYAATKTSITNHYQGDLYEMIAFDRELTPAETQKVESYVAIKYGVSMVNSKPFSAKITNSEAANRLGKDYVLSDGTVIWPGASQKGLDAYHAYFNFLVRDDASALRIFKSKPANTLNDWKSSYPTTIYYFDNNVSVANGSNFDAPKRLADKTYFVMAGTTVYHADSVASTTPYTSSLRVFNGSTYQCWDRVYKVKTKGVDTVSIQVDALAPISNTYGNQFGCTDWAANYGSNPGILLVSGTTTRFIPGQLQAGVLKVNGVPAIHDADLYLVFASTLGELKINEQEKNLCLNGSPFQFTASIPGGVWSSNAPEGVYTPAVSGVDTITYTYNGIKAKTPVAVIHSPSATVLLDRNTLYNGQKGYAEVTTAQAGFRPMFRFGLDESNYTTADELSVFTFDAAAVSVGTHTLDVKVKPAADCASEFTASVSFTRANEAKEQPAGVEGAALWMRADKVKTFSGTAALEMENLGESTLSLKARVNADTVAAEQTANWANGQMALNFTGQSLYETNQIKNWKAFFIVHDFRAVSKTPLTMIYDNPEANPALVQGTSECYFFNLSGGSGYGWQTGFQREQKVNLFGSTWGVPDNSLFVSPSLQYLQEKGLGLPLMSSFVKRSLNRYVQSVNGAAALEYTRPESDANMKTLDLPGRLFLGAAYKPSYEKRFSKHLDGRIAEFIAFDRYLSAYEISKIESYLAMRYGFSIRGYHADKGFVSNSDYRDYLLSDGTLVYPVASDGGLQNYWEQVHFLVRDDATLLHNKVSSPISHGQQYGVADIIAASSAVYAFNKSTAEPRGGRVITASPIEVAVGASFASPSDIATDKAFFAMGTKEVEPTLDYGYYCVENIVFKLAARTVCKQRVNGIPKVSFKIAAMPATPFETGAGILQVKGSDYRYSVGTLNSTSLLINNVTPWNDAECMVVTGMTTNPIVFASIADARKGETYYGAVSASATGSTSFTYRLVLGALPEGLSMDESGTISGTPTTAGGSSNFTVRATDQRGLYKEQAFAMQVLSDINCAPVAQPRAMILAGKVGETSVVSLRVPEIAGYRILGLASGALPEGMSLQENGILQGVPQAEGVSKFVVRVKNQEGCTDDVVFDVGIERSTQLDVSLVTVYPNPASEEATLTINAELPDVLRMQLFGVNNQRVRTETYAAGTKQIRLDLTGLTTGQYFIVLSSQGKKATLPILVK